MYAPAGWPSPNQQRGCANRMFVPSFSAQLIMNLVTLLSSVGLLLFGSGCGGPTKVQYLHSDSAQQQPTQQAEQQTGQPGSQPTSDTVTASGLRTRIVRAYKQENYAQARADIALLGERYPKSQLYVKLSRLNGILDSLVGAQQQRVQVKQARRAHSPGATTWGTAEYQDEFGKLTGNFFMVNTTVQWGKYANTAVVSEDMAARLLVDSSASIRLVLYDEIPKHAIRSAGRTTYQRTDDYDLMRPVKVMAPTKYVVKVRSNAGKVHTFMAVNSLDRLVLDEYDSETLHACLLEGGEVSFFIMPADQPSTTYRFTLENADEYEQAYYALRRR